MYFASSSSYFLKKKITSHTKLRRWFHFLFKLIQWNSKGLRMSPNALKWCYLWRLVDVQSVAILSDFWKSQLGSLWTFSCSYNLSLLDLYIYKNKWSNEQCLCPHRFVPKLVSKKIWLFNSIVRELYYGLRLITPVFKFCALEETLWLYDG